MTKLMQWLTTLVLLFAVWISLLMSTSIDYDHKKIVFLLPLFAVIGFGLVSLLIIIYRVATFNDCQAAAEELQKEIEAAKKDLLSKGFVFKS